MPIVTSHRYFPAKKLHVLSVKPTTGNPITFNIRRAHSGSGDTFSLVSITNSQGTTYPKSQGNAYPRTLALLQKLLPKQKP